MYEVQSRALIFLSLRVKGFRAVDKVTHDL